MKVHADAKNFNFFGFWESFNNTCHPPKTIIDCSDITSYGCKVDDVDWLFKLKYNPLLSHCSSGRKVADFEHPCRYRLKAMKSMCSSNCPSEFKLSDKKVSFSFILIDGRIVEVDTFGKEPCDGVGGTVKRLAARASLQRPINNQITTPRQLFEFAESEIKSVNFYYATINEYETEANFLITRLAFNRYRQGCSKSATFLPLLQ